MAWYGQVVLDKALVQQAGWPSQILQADQLARAVHVNTSC